MRQTLGTAALVLLTSCIVCSTPRSAAADTALGTSTWSLEVGTSLGSGSGDASFAVRRHSGASSAFRFGVDANVIDNDGDGTRTETGSPDSDALQNGYYGNYAFSIQWMRFASIRDNVTATFGLGPVVTMNRQGARQEFGSGLSTFSGYEYSSRETTYGLDSAAKAGSAPLPEPTRM